MPKRNSWGKIRELKSGRFQASHVSPDHERLNGPTTFSTKKAAQAWLAAQRTLIEQGKWSRNITVDPNFYSYALRHIEVQTSSRGTSLQPSTKELYRRLLTNNLKEFHDLELSSISKPKVDTWWQEASGSGKVTSASKAYKLLHSILNRAVMDDFIDNNPCRIRGAHSAVTGKKMHVPNVDEVGEIILNITPRFKAAICLAAYGGLRFGEWSCLTRSDLELIQNSRGNYFRVSINKAASKVGNKIHLGKTKSEDGIRIIDLPSQLSGIVSNHLVLHAESGILGLVFPSKIGNYVRHDVFIKQFNKACDLAGLKTNPHALRHFGASVKVRMGMTFPQLKKWLGDSTNDAALGYVHATNEELSAFREMPTARNL